MDKEIDFLTVKEVSQSLRIHWQTTLTYIKNNKLKAFKLGNGYRIAKSDLLDFINNQSTRRIL